MSAAAALLGGFVDLVAGGITLAPILLLMAYVGFIPAAITLWGRIGPAPQRTAESRPRPPYGAATLLAAVVFTLYLATLAPSTAMWDTSEYIAAAFTMGLPHPPGNPFFIIVGRVFSLLPIAGSVAARINVLAAICSAASAGLWFLVAEQVLAKVLTVRWARFAGAAAAATIGATAFTVWNQSVVNEKVYTVSLLGIAIVAWLTFCWLHERGERRGDALLVLIAYLLGLGYANHMAGALPGPAVALAVLLAKPRTILRVRLIVLGALTFALGMTPFATQPIRAAYFPAINEGEPTGCRTHLSASCTFSKETYDAFMYNFERKQYGKPELTVRQAPFTAQIGMWWEYFRWQWLRDVHGDWPATQSFLAAVFLGLGLAGAAVHYARDRGTFWFFGALMFTMTILLVYYLNFKYGASQLADPGVDREVRDRDYFFLWSFSAWGVWAGLGLVYMWQAAAALIGGDARTIHRRFALASPVLFIALVPLMGNWHAASRARDRDASAFAKDLLNSVEPYGVLITAGDNDTFPLWYAQEVEGVRRDVIVACTSLLGTDWYPRQMVRRPLYTYDAAKGPAVYRGRDWRKPTRPPVRMTVMQTDSVPGYMELRGPVVFEANGIRAIIDPRKLEYGALMRADIFVLQMIHDAWPERPIYFARTDGGYVASLGLDGNVLTQGLASKLFIPASSAAPARDTVMIAGAGWFDTSRTRALWDSVYTGPAALITKGDWIDQPSIGIPFLYVQTGALLASVLQDRGEVKEARRVFDTAREVASAARLSQLLGGALEVEAPTSVRGDTSGVTLGQQRSADQIGKRPKR